MTKFKMELFNNSESGTINIRYKILPNGKIIAFGIAINDLSMMHFSVDSIDFDKESDDIIEKHENSDSNHAFEYVPNIGFSEVKTNKQNWFVFE